MFRQTRKESFTYQDKPEGESVFKAEVYFSRGGMNYFNYKDEPRGIYFSISEVKIELRNGMKIESFMMCSPGRRALKTLVMPLERFNAKRLQSVATVLAPNIAAIVELFKTDQAAAFNRVRELMGLAPLVPAASS